MSKKALLVDDDEAFCRSLGRFMELEKDWEFDWAYDADEGLEKIKSLRPDVVVLDFDLGPRSRNGFDLLKDLRAEPEFRFLPVLILTGIKSELESKIEGLGLGADDYITKPVKPGILVARLGAAVSKFRRDLRSL